MDRDDVVKIIYAATPGQKKSLQGLDLQGVDLSKLDLTGVDFTGCNLIGANFSNANISKALFDNANLYRARMHQTDARGAVFIGCDLQRTLFTDAQLDSARMVGCDLDGAHVPANLGSKVDLRATWWNQRPKGATKPIDMPRVKPVLEASKMKESPIKLRAGRVPFQSLRTI